MLKTNAIYCGDNLAVLQGFEDNSVNLFYGDPQFFTNKKYETFWGDSQELRMFEDVWVKQGEGRYSKDINVYLNFMEPRLREIHRVLKPTGSFYLHCDDNASHYLKVLIDQIFGYGHFINEIIWKRSANRSGMSKIYKREHDSLLFYVKGDKYTYNMQFREIGENTLKNYHYDDERGRYRLVPLLVSGITKQGETGKVWMNVDPNKQGKSGMHWVCKLEKREEYVKKGLVVVSKNGIPNLKYYLETAKGVPMNDVWDDINLIQSNDEESLGWPTQKPEALIERIIKASSNEGDVVLDAWCGCYDDQTEILTDKGWKLFRNLEIEDRVASLDDDKMIMVKPLARQSYHYSGDMHAWKSTRCDLVVTPDHNMYVSERKTFPGLHYDPFNFVKSESVKWLSRIKRSCTGNIQEKGNVEIPNDIEPVKWCKFLGLWIGDGSIVSKEAKGYKIDIRQTKIKNHPWIENVLNDINVHWAKNSGDTRFQFSDREIYEYLEKLGKQPVRRIPRDIILKGSTKMLESLVEGLVISDGMIKKGTKVIYTISRGLCDDIAECFIRLGMAVHITSRQPRTEKHKSNDGRDFWSKSVCYCITGASVRIDYALHKPEIVKYDGIVYCVTVPSHVILVRRNDKIVWCGNCGTTLKVAKDLDRQYVGIDISPTACRLVANRIGYPLAEIIGMAFTADEIAALTGYEFQNAVIRLLDPTLNTIKVNKKGADGGIDGTYFDLLISVKKFKAGRKDLDEFVATMYRNKEKTGMFIALEYSSDFTKEVARLGREQGITIHPFTLAQVVAGAHVSIITKENQTHGRLI